MFQLIFACDPWLETVHHGQVSNYVPSDEIAEVSDWSHMVMQGSNSQPLNVLAAGRIERTKEFSHPKTLQPIMLSINIHR